MVLGGSMILSVYVIDIRGIFNVKFWCAILELALMQGEPTLA
jgi:hypothetical protein